MEIDIDIQSCEIEHVSHQNGGHTYTNNGRCVHSVPPNNVGNAIDRLEDDIDSIKLIADADRTNIMILQTELDNTKQILMQLLQKQEDEEFARENNPWIDDLYNQYQDGLTQVQ